MLTRRTFLMTVASSVMCLCGCTLKKCDGSPVTYPFSNWMVDDASLYITVDHYEFDATSERLSKALYDNFIGRSCKSSPKCGMLHEDYLNDSDDTLVRAVTFEVFYKNYPALVNALEDVARKAPHGEFSEEREGEREVSEPDNTVSDRSHSDNYTHVTVYLIGRPLDGGD